MRVKDSAPVFEAPRARANAYLLLVKQVQLESRKYSIFPFGKAVAERNGAALKI
jgi:hypothetical protein